jgi:hypothetical protein
MFPTTHIFQTRVGLLFNLLAEGKREHRLDLLRIVDLIHILLYFRDFYSLWFWSIFASDELVARDM